MNNVLYIMLKLEEQISY